MYLPEPPQGACIQIQVKDLKKWLLPCFLFLFERNIIFFCTTAVGLQAFVQVNQNPIILMERRCGKTNFFVIPHSKKTAIKAQNNNNTTAHALISTNCIRWQGAHSRPPCTIYNICFVNCANAMLAHSQPRCPQPKAPLSALSRIAIPT